jgi:hypothetical protein
MIKKKNEKEKKPGKLKPVEGYSKPVYPEKEVITRNRELLFDYVPSWWLKTGISTATFFVLTLNTYNIQAIDLNGDENRVICDEGKKHKQEIVQKEKVLIAPLFIHGDGIGATGCIVVSPPVFISEADAFEVIVTALEKEGITFDKRNHLLRNIYSIDKYAKLSYESEEAKDIKSVEKFPFFFDFYSTEYNLGIKFVSKDNYNNFAEMRSLAQDEKKLPKKKPVPLTITEIYNNYSSVHNFDMITVSQRIRECLREYGDVNAVLFYDPLVETYGPLAYGKYDRERAKVLDETRKLLRQQVKDFSTWFRQTFKKSEKTGGKGNCQ